MTDQLALGGVVRSYEESSRILDQLRERLASLASSDEVRQESSDSLQRSAGQLADLTSELGAAVEQLVVCRRTARRGCRSDASAVGGSDAGGLAYCAR